MPGFGWLPDPEKAPKEKADWNAAEVLGADLIPLSATCRAYILTILNQGSWPICVGHAVMQAVRASHVRQGVEEPMLGSRLWAHYLSKAQHNATDKDSGTFLRTMFYALDKMGFPPENEWPYRFDEIDNQPRWKLMPPTKAFSKAFDQRSPVKYRKIFETGDGRILEVKRAIAKGYCVVFGTTVTTAFVQGEFDIAQPPKLGEIVAGGHAMLLAEYDADNFGVVNSWGKNWKDGGWCRFSNEYVASPHSRDFWIVEHAPDYSEKAVKS